MLPIHSVKGVVKKDHISWFIFGLMASVTFIGILSELVPSGILPQMTQGLGIEETQVGFLVGIYALASAIFAIPLISMTLAINRKKFITGTASRFCAIQYCGRPDFFVLPYCGHAHSWWYLCRYYVANDCRVWCRFGDGRSTR